MIPQHQSLPNIENIRYCLNENNATRFYSRYNEYKGANIEEHLKNLHAHSSAHDHYIEAYYSFVQSCVKRALLCIIYQPKKVEKFVTQCL